MHDKFIEMFENPDVHVQPYCEVEITSICINVKIGKQE